MFITNAEERLAWQRRRWEELTQVIEEMRFAPDAQAGTSRPKNPADAADNAATALAAAGNAIGNSAAYANGPAGVARAGQQPQPRLPTFATMVAGGSGGGGAQGAANIVVGEFGSKAGMSRTGAGAGAGAGASRGSMKSTPLGSRGDTASLPFAATLTQSLPRSLSRGGHSHSGLGRGHGHGSHSSHGDRGGVGHGGGGGERSGRIGIPTMASPPLRAPSNAFTDGTASPAVRRAGIFGNVRGAQRSTASVPSVDLVRIAAAMVGCGVRAAAA